MMKIRLENQATYVAVTVSSAASASPTLGVNVSSRLVAVSLSLRVVNSLIIHLRQVDLRYNKKKTIKLNARDDAGFQTIMVQFDVVCRAVLMIRLARMADQIVVYALNPKTYSH